MGDVYSSRSRRRKENETLSLRIFYLLSELLSYWVLDIVVNFIHSSINNTNIEHLESLYVFTFNLYSLKNQREDSVFFSCSLPIQYSIILFQNKIGTSSIIIFPLFYIFIRELFIVYTTWCEKSEQLKLLRFFWNIYVWTV